MYITTLNRLANPTEIQKQKHIVGSKIIKRSSENNPNEFIHQSAHIIVGNGIDETTPIGTISLELL